ncbi:MAG: GntR family transcriptional regulator [Eubacteriales bacterium]
MIKNWMIVLDDLVENIIAEEHEPDMKLPSESDLVAKHKVSRYDVRKAYDRLEEMGYIYSIQGKGRYYKSKNDKIRLVLAGDISFTEKMKNLGYDLRTENIYFKELKNANKIKRRMNLHDIDKVFKVSRLRIIDKIPSAIHISYVSDKYLKNIKIDGPYIKSMFNYYKKHNYDDFYFKESVLQTLLPTKFERYILKCPSLVPVMLLESQCIDKLSDNILELTKIIYRGDRFIYKFKP